jgi:hypothetical protein
MHPCQSVSATQPTLRKCHKAKQRSAAHADESAACRKVLADQGRRGTLRNAEQLHLARPDMLSGHMQPYAARGLSDGEF